MASCLPEQPKPTVVAIDDVADRQEDATPPDGGYGWVCVGACFTINCFTWGTVSVSLLWRIVQGLL